MSIPSVPHTPQNPNVLHPNKFVVSFAALPDVEYWCQSVNVPGLTLGEAIRATPFIDLYSPGDKLIINPFAITFTVDEDLLGWLEVYKWMRGITFPKEFSEYANLDKRFAAWKTPMPQFSDATLVILDSKQNARIRVKFHNCFPTSLTDLLLSATSSPESPVTADAVFRFDLYEIERLRP
jgi:hypothetical protein